MSLSEHSDVELVQRFKRGDAEAFGALVCRYQDRIYRLALVWLHDPQKAADVVQEVFLRAHRGLGRFRFAAAPFTWLYRTAFNVCREYNRVHVSEALETEPVDTRSNTERQAIDRQHAQRVRELVAELSERQQQVVLLRVFEELSVRDTAKLMGCREGTVKALLHKAMARLRLHGDSLVTRE